MSFTSLQHTNAVVPSGDICIYTDISAATRARLWDTQTQLSASLACLWRPGPHRVRLKLVRKDTEKIHAGDLLVEVNGESVARCDMRMLSQMVPGPVGTPVVLRLRSVKGNQEFEVSAERHT